MTLSGVTPGTNAVPPIRPAASATRPQSESTPDAANAASGAPAPSWPTHINAKPGDTAFGIAQRYREAMGAGICQIVVALWRANPQAFEQHDMNMLKPDVSIELPGIDTVRLLGPEEAAALCAVYIDPAEQRRHGTVGLTIRKSFEDQRELQPGERELVFFRDFLGQIANRFNVGGATLNQKLVAIATANPDAFNNGNMNDLRSGVLLRMPSAEAVQAIDPATADAEVSSQWAAWKAYTQPSNKC